MVDVTDSSRCRGDVVIVIAATLTAFSVYLFMKPLPTQRRPRNRLTRIIHGESKKEDTKTSAVSPTILRVTGIVGGALLGATFGGFMGLVIGVLAGTLLIRILGKRDSGPSDAEAAKLVLDTPVLIDLLAATLASGATMRSSLAAATAAMLDSPVRMRLSPVIAAIELGADPRDAWSALASDPTLGQLARSVMRSYDSGAGLESVLLGIASEMRREHRSRVEVAARTAGVKAVIPLAVCFLPGFFALGVIPIVASLAASTGFLPG